MTFLGWILIFVVTKDQRWGFSTRNMRVFHILIQADLKRNMQRFRFSFQPLAEFDCQWAKCVKGHLKPRLMVHVCWFVLYFRASHFVLKLIQVFILLGKGGGGYYGTFLFELVGLYFCPIFHNDCIIQRIANKCSMHKLHVLSISMNQSDVFKCKDVSKYAEVSFNNWMSKYIYYYTKQISCLS